MSKAYIVAHIRVHDEDGYEKFKNANAAAFERHGGKLLVRGGETEHLEGGLRGRVIVIEFDDMEHARGFYHSKEYQAAGKFRQDSADTYLLIAAGV